MERASSAVRPFAEGLGGHVQIIDNKYRLFGVINLIDLAVVIALIAGGFAVYKVLKPSTVPTTGGSSNTKTVNYVFYCPQLRNFAPSQIKIGDQVFKTSGKVIGKVTAVRSVATPMDVYDLPTQAMKPSGSAIATDVYVTVVGQGQPLPTGVAVSDLLLHANQPVPIMTSTFESDGAIVADMKIAGE